MIHFLKISQNKIKYFFLQQKNFRKFFSTAKNQILQHRFFQGFFSVFFSWFNFRKSNRQTWFSLQNTKYSDFFSILKV